MSTPQHSQFDIEVFEAFLQEQMQWASVQFPFGTLAQKVPDLIAEIEEFDPISTASLIAGLLTVPEYQSSTLRIELLGGLVLAHARGSRVATVGNAACWFIAIGESGATTGEDAAEDVMVTLVTTPKEQFRMLEGLWESAGFYTQRMLDVLAGMPDIDTYRDLKASVRALLMVAEMTCERADLIRYQTGSDSRPGQLDLATLPPANTLRARTTISRTDLAARGVALEDLRPFILSPEHAEKLIDQEPGVSELDRRPLIPTADGVVLVLPTAITVAVRQRIIDVAISMKQVETFDRHYAYALAKTVAETTLLGWKSGCPLRWHPTAGGALAGAVIPFDRGHTLMLHFVLPSIASHDPSWFKHPIEIHETLEKALNFSIASNTEQLERADDFRGGMHVVVMCGWGQGMAIPVTRPNDARWRGESISIADLIRLSNVEDMSVPRFWRLASAEKALEEAGVELMNVNGVLNLFAWMKANNGHLIPHEDLGDGKISRERPLMVSLPLNLLRDVRAAADQSIDAHVGVDPKGMTHHLQRVDRSPLFPGTASNRVYACVQCAEEGTLVAACEGRATMWLRAACPHLTSRDIEFRLWDMLGKWGGAIIEALEEATEVTGDFEITVVFEDVQSEVDAPETAIPADPTALLRLEVTGARAATIHAARGFLHASREPTNDAERALTKQLLQGMLTLALVENPQPLVERLTADLLPNDTGRYFHVMHAHDFTDYVRHALPHDFLQIDEIDSATQRLGLAWAVYDGDSRVEGVNACVGMLNKLVDARVLHVVNRLVKLDRAAVLERLLLNHEAAHAKEMRWKRTSAAVLGLHGDSDELRATVVKQLSITSGATITSRVLAEMAVCEAPISGGRLPDDLEIQALLSEVALLIRLGGLSDGIYYKVLKPTLRISPLGDILLQDEFGSDVVEPMLSQAVGGSYAQSASGFRRNYAAQAPVDRVEHRFDPEFVKAWEVEMGFGIDQARHLLDAIESEGIARRAPTLQMKHSELVALLSTHVDAMTAERFIDQFQLPQRKRWADVPRDFKSREILPWRYGRRLSIVTRPILQLDDNADPTYIFAPRLVRSGFFYLLRGAYDGTLDQEFFHTPEMRDRWWGKTNEGHTFNAQVADRLQTAGWRVEKNIELTAIFRAKLDRDFGDVDILAWCPNRKEIFVIECKDLSLRRNYSEIAALVSDYQGETKNGKPDKLKRHLIRVQCIAADLPSVSRFTGIEAPEIVSCLVVAGLVPMQFASTQALEQTFVGDVDAFLKRFGACTQMEAPTLDSI